MTTVATKKWSSRIRHGLVKSGKKWGDEQEYKDKHEIALLIAKHPKTAINQAHETVIEALVSALESKLKLISGDE